MPWPGLPASRDAGSWRCPQVAGDFPRAAGRKTACDQRVSASAGTTCTPRDGTPPSSSLPPLVLLQHNPPWCSSDADGVQKLWSSFGVELRGSGRLSLHGLAVCPGHEVVAGMAPDICHAEVVDPGTAGFNLLRAILLAWPMATLLRSAVVGKRSCGHLAGAAT